MGSGERWGEVVKGGKGEVRFDFILLAEVGRGW
jgi:hypothetical protein